MATVARNEIGLAAPMQRAVAGPASSAVAVIAQPEHGLPSAAQRLPGPPTGAVFARKSLNSVLGLWFGVTLVGQLLFVLHITSFYGRAVFTGDLARWNKALSVGYVAGDHLGNSALSAHLIAAGVLTLAGLLQLLGAVRSRFPRFHRWTGRTYVVMAFLGAGSALYLQIVRGHVPGSLLQHSALVINALLIMIFAVLTAGYAMARKFEQHRRWAVRLFLVTSGSWFFRVGLFAWMLINRGPVGFDPDKFEGPALEALCFLQFLLPLAVCELYWCVQRSGSTAGRLSVAALLLVLTFGIAIGIFGHTAFELSSGVAF